MPKLRLLHEQPLLGHHSIQSDATNGQQSLGTHLVLADKKIATNQSAQKERFFPLRLHLDGSRHHRHAHMLRYPSYIQAIDGGD